MRKAQKTPQGPTTERLRFGIAAALGLFLLCSAPAMALAQSAGSGTSSVASAPIPGDAVSELIALSTSHFEAGQRELREGHLEMAKAEFNKSLEVLLESRFGARTVPRIREHFDRLVERISAYELTALAQGDGFTEKRYEPATIDDLLTISTFEQPPATPETKRAVSDDLQETPHDIDIPLNGRVLQYVQLFSGRLKSYLEDGLSRGVQYLPMIQEVFRAEGLPLDLAYVPLIESAFKPSALSKAKAKGIWQFMRGTALENGLQHDWYIDERADPEKATRAAAKYLTTLHNMFGDWHLALASYNGGPGRVQRAVKRSKRTDFWQLSASSRYLPRETRDYVPLILAAIVIARNPAQYGLAIVEPELPQTERVTVYGPIDLRKVAEWAGVPAEVIQDLNPELRRWTTPVRATDYTLTVPQGTGARILAAMGTAEPEDLVSFNRYTVKKGETIQTIAKKLKVSRTDLAEANYLSTKARLDAGQQLIIPRAPTTMLAARTDTPAPVAESRSVDAVAASNVRPPVVQNASAASGVTRLTHKVRRGETLFSIANLYQTTVAALKQWNRISGSAIKIGQRLTILRSGSATN
ncbi:MAG TPA: LysM peptidoglycan-binding domain-containing protein [Vicinamibacterales bacterium]|nr:LysM peptidoglycan-binding domain-containing protein [Vicinamibacterales bacterium]